MMDHARYRMLIGADPRSSDPELRGHRESCQECQLYTERLLRFESRLERALQVAVPMRAEVAPFAAKAVPRIAKSWRWMAMAASVLLGVVVAAGIWLVLPGASLAADVVAHMREEPQAWRRTDVAVPDAELNDILRESNLRLGAAAGIVSYASSCAFRGHQVPHLVVQTPSGPVTVMVLVHESVSRLTQFDEQGYRGTIVPMPGHGSIAVLMQNPGAAQARDLQRIAAQVRASIVWTR
ncbi:MAG TPA: DUF3379 family protein [Steroidobacteraceae bacterium]|nr:DUF3379 family protein [Steroidobacteraceae bacterium]